MGGYCRDLAATSEAPRGAPGVKTSVGSDRGGALDISLVADVPREVEEEHEHPDDNGQPNKIFMSIQTNKKKDYLVIYRKILCDQICQIFYKCNLVVTDPLK